MSILTEVLAKNPLAEQQIPAVIYLIMAGLGFCLGATCAAAKTGNEKAFSSVKVGAMRLLTAGAGIGIGAMLVVGGILTQEPQGIAVGVAELASFAVGYLGVQ